MSSPCAGCAKHRQRMLGTGPVIIYTAGVFDLLHHGHLNVLRRSRALGDILVVGVVSDAGTAAYKGHRPIQSEATRLQVIRALEFVDFALLQPGTDPTPNLEAIRPHIMTHGDEWQRLREGHESLERLGVQWRLIPHTPGISTTALRAQVQEAR